MFRSRFLVAILASFIYVGKADAFPEMIRHGYSQCMACHHSPSGGGILTPYGRVLANEHMSNSGSETEAKFLYGAVPDSENLSLGGDIRWVQWYRDTPTSTSSDFVPMQADLEAAGTLGKFKAVATLGYQEVQAPAKFLDSVISRRHYLLYQVNDNLTLRAGRYQVPFGLMIPDHFTTVRRGLMWDQNTETHNIEAVITSDPWELFLTGSLGRLDTATVDREKGFSFRAGYSFLEKQKVGLSYFYGANDAQTRHVVGPYALISLSPSWTVLTEVDFQNQQPAGRAAVWGLFNYNRMNYEMIKGFVVFGSAQVSFANLDREITRFVAYGGGLQFFARPHFEVQVSYEKQKINALFDRFTDFAFLMFHYYL